MTFQFRGIFNWISEPWVQKGRADEDWTTIESLSQSHGRVNNFWCGVTRVVWVCKDTGRSDPSTRPGFKSDRRNVHTRHGLPGWHDEKLFWRAFDPLSWHNFLVVSRFCFCQQILFCQQISLVSRFFFCQRISLLSRFAFCQQISIVSSFDFCQRNVTCSN